MRASDLDVLPQDIDHWISNTVLLLRGEPVYCVGRVGENRVMVHAFHAKWKAGKFPSDMEDDAMRATREVELEDLQLWWPEEGYYQINGVRSTAIGRPADAKSRAMSKAILVMRRVARIYKKSCCSKAYQYEQVEPWYVPDAPTFEWEVLCRRNIFTGLYPYVTQVYRKSRVEPHQIYDMAARPEVESMALSRHVALVRSPTREDSHIWFAIYGMSRINAGMWDMRENAFYAEKGGAVLRRVLKRLPDGVRCDVT